MPASARLATFATAMTHTSPEESNASRASRFTWRLALCALLELGHALFEGGELCLRFVQQLALNVEVLAHHNVHAVEPAGEERSEILLDVLSRGIAQRFVDARAEVVEQRLVHRQRP